MEWLENVPDKWHKLFVACGLLDPRHASAVKKIVDHLEDYREYLSRKGTLERHWKQEYSRSKKVVKALKASYWNRITPTGILSVLAELKQKHGWKSRTYNSYLVSFKSFLNWAVRDCRLRENMAQHIPSLNEKVDQTAVQRRLSHEELQRLINAAINGEKHHGLTGNERELLYLIAMETGLRWAELYRLTAGDFIMVTDIPYIKAGKTKNGKECCKPLRSYLADMVKGHLATLSGSKDEQFLPGMWKERAYKMIKMDMEAAGIPYKVDGVKFSFHGLRHTYISLGGDNSKSISTVQAMADHASARTTARYLHPEFKEELDTLAKFPNYLAATEEAETLKNCK